jgi:hypothetical protein
MRRLALSAALVLLVAGAVGAQPTAGAGRLPSRSDVEAVAPPRGLPVEQERDPGRGPTPPEPVFLEPAVVTTEHLRVGPSAWIAAGPPFEHRENPGGPAVGVTISWPPPTSD